MRVTVAQVSLYAGEVRCDPPVARCAELSAGLRQRLALLEAILADLFVGQQIRRFCLLPELLLQHHPALRSSEGGHGGAMLPRYAAELILCPDGAWRIRSERTAAAQNHPAAALFEAPLVAPFLPALCRALLRETLRLPSIPTLWLSDPAARAAWAADPSKWLVHHGFDPPSACVDLPRATLCDRLEWQRRQDTAPWALTASHAWCWSDLHPQVSRGRPSSGGVRGNAPPSLFKTAPRA